MNIDTLAVKHFKMKCERTWQHENSARNRSTYPAAVNRYNFLLQQAKSSHISRIVAENEGKLKSPWNSLKKIPHKSSDVILLNHTSLVDLEKYVSMFFQCENFQNWVWLTIIITHPSHQTQPYSEPCLPSHQKLRIYPKASKTKTCDLGPISTSCADILKTPMIEYCFAKERETVLAQQKQGIPMSNNDFAEITICRTVTKKNVSLSFMQKFKMAIEKGGKRFLLKTGRRLCVYLVGQKLNPNCPNLTLFPWWENNFWQKVLDDCIYSAGQTLSPNHSISHSFRDKCVFAFHLDNKATCEISCKQVKCFFRN